MTIMDNHVRALYDDTTITVYQAYNKAITEVAVRHQTFAPPFKMERMTWIKPSSLWMMYRSGWASKENQEHILAVKIKREGFECCLANSCLSHFDAGLYDTHDKWKERLLHHLCVSNGIRKRIFTSAVAQPFNSNRHNG